MVGERRKERWEWEWEPDEPVEVDAFEGLAWVRVVDPASG